MNQYFKYKSSYGPRLSEWWLYAKVIIDNKDNMTCQVFQFQKTSRDTQPQYIAGADAPFMGNIDTNKYQYYQDLYSPCTKEEFEKELKLFMQDLNAYVEFVNYSP